MRARELISTVVFALLGAAAAPVLTVEPTGDEWAGLATAGIVWLLVAFAIAALLYHLGLRYERHPSRRIAIERALGAGTPSPRTLGLRTAALAAAGAITGLVASGALMHQGPTPTGWGAAVIVCCVSAILGLLVGSGVADVAAGIMQPVTRADIGMENLSGPIGRKITRVAGIGIAVIAVVGIVIRLLPPHLVPPFVLSADNPWIAVLAPQFAAILLISTLGEYVLATLLRRVGLMLPNTGSSTLALLRHCLTTPGARATGTAAVVALSWFLVGQNALPEYSAVRLAHHNEQLAAVVMLEPAPGVDSSTANSAAHQLETSFDAVVVDARVLHVTAPGVEGGSGAVVVFDPAQVDSAVPGGVMPYGLADGLVLQSGFDVKEQWFRDWAVSAKPVRIGVDVANDGAAMRSVEALTLTSEAPFSMTTPATVSPLLSASTPVYLVWLPPDAKATVSELASSSGGALSASELSPTQPESPPTAVTWFFAGVGLLLGSIGAAFQALRVSKRTMGVRATLLALGARPRALALATAIDAALMSAIAAPLGLAASLPVSLPRVLPALVSPGAPFPPNLLETIGWHIGAWPLGVTVVLLASSTTLAALTAWLLALRTAGKAPVDQLKEAIKEGAL